MALLSAEGSKQRQEFFDKYRESLFPYVPRGQRNEQDRIKAILHKSFVRGPFKIKP